MSLHRDQSKSLRLFWKMEQNDSIKVYKQAALNRPGGLDELSDPAPHFLLARKANQAALANFDTGQVVNNSTRKNTLSPNSACLNFSGSLIIGENHTTWRNQTVC
jgi:hypothetical protein